MLSDSCVPYVRRTLTSFCLYTPPVDPDKCFLCKTDPTFQKIPVERRKQLSFDRPIGGSLRILPRGPQTPSRKVYPYPPLSPVRPRTSTVEVTMNYLVRDQICSWVIHKPIVYGPVFFDWKGETYSRLIEINDLDGSTPGRTPDAIEAVR